MVVTLLDILKELCMAPSRAHVGKGPRNERELLRYKAHVGDISSPENGKWEWNDDDAQLAVVREIMQSYKDGERAPSGWKTLPKGGPAPGATGGASGGDGVADDIAQDVKPSTEAKMEAKKESETKLEDKKAVKNEPKEEPETKVTLMDILKELQMTPSYAKGGRGARNERELLRYNVHIGKITAPTNGKWEWMEHDAQLPAIREILQDYKQGARAPSGWRKLPAVTATTSHAAESYHVNDKKRNEESKRDETVVTKKSKRA